METDYLQPAPCALAVRVFGAVRARTAIPAGTAIHTIRAPIARGAIATIDAIDAIGAGFQGGFRRLFGAEVRYFGNVSILILHDDLPPYVGLKMHIPHKCDSDK